MRVVRIVYVVFACALFASAANVRAQATDAGVPAAPRLTLAVFSTAIFDIDARIAQATHETLIGVGNALGYAVIETQDNPSTRALAPHELWQATTTANSHRGIQARVWAADGRYVIELIVASLDGAGPFFGRDTASAADFRDVLARLVNQTLPAPSTWNPQILPPVILPSAIGRAPQIRATTVRWLLGDPRTEARQPRQFAAHHWGIALALEPSIGLNQGSFFNQYIGLRFDYRLTRDLFLGALVQYANLEGREHREHSLQLALQGEDRLHLSRNLPLVLPLRVALGYLFSNGATLRLSAGLAWALSDEWEIGVDLVAPTFYFMSNRFAVAVNFGIEVVHRFGP